MIEQFLDISTSVKIVDDNDGLGNGKLDSASITSGLSLQIGGIGDRTGLGEQARTWREDRPLEGKGGSREKDRKDPKDRRGETALARAIGTLLRCQRAQLNERATTQIAAARTGGIVGALLIGLVVAVKQAMGRANALSNAVTPKNPFS